VAAALVLSAFGVALEQVLEDFELTDATVDLERALFEQTTSSIALGDDYEFLKKIGHAARAPVIRADRDYLLSAFEQIERNDGSIEGYLRTKLGVTDEMLMQAKVHLVAESPPPHV
jgi:protein tyrosine/serine phosphatase